MSISVNSVTRTATVLTASTTANATAAPAVTAKTTSTTDTAPATATPLRFPWLSRLTTELEPVAKQKPAFQAAPQLGDNLDQAA